MSLTLNPATLARQQADETADYYHVGQATILLIKAGGAPVAAPVLHGRLIVPQSSGWALLTVPNALVRGLFDAMDETGLELPPDSEGRGFNAHISVMTADEVKKLGGPDAISERGHPFTYQLGPMQSVEPQGWDAMSRAWFIKVISPELKALRKSYGLTPLPHGDHHFHITVAVRRKNVLNPGPASKAAAADENDDDDVHSGPPKGVHQDEDNDGPVKVRIPLVMRRITMTTLSFGKPGDGDDNDHGLQEFFDRMRERASKAGEKQGAVMDPLGRRKRRPVPWTKSDVARTAVTGGLVGGGGYALGSGLENIGKQLAFQPDPSWQLSDANRYVQSQPDTAGAVEGYVTQFPQAMNKKIYGESTPYQIMSGLRTEGSALRKVLWPLASWNFPDTFNDNARIRAHYAGFAAGPVSAYKTLMREYLSDNDAADILGNIDVARPKLLEQSARNVLALDPNATPEQFLKEYGDQIVKTHVPPPPTAVGSAFNAVRGMPGPSEARGPLGPNPFGKAQAAVTFRRLALNVEDKLPKGEKALDYFNEAKQIFAKGTLSGDDSRMATRAAEITRPGQAAQALGLSPYMPAGDPAEKTMPGGIPSPELRSLQPPNLKYVIEKKLDDAVAAKKLELGNKFTPADEAAVVKDIIGKGDPHADLAALKIDKHLTVTGASFMYDTLNRILALPGHAARFAQQTAPYMKALAPAAGLGLAGYGLYRYMNQPRTKRKPAPAPVMPASMKAAADGGLSDILAGWTPPKENPYAGFEGFAGTFHPPTSNEQLAESLGRMSLTAAPAAALAGGLALWRPWESTPPKPVRRHPHRLKTAASLGEMAGAAYGQLPRIRLPDTLIGAGVGAAGGLGYDAVRSMIDKKPAGWRKHLGRVLTGAGVGALGANVVGDRARRYITNSFVPFGYENDATKALKPRSWSHVWNAAIMDRPQYEVSNPEGLERLRDKDSPAVPVAKGDYDYRKDTLENYILPARREIFRRQLGVHTDDPTRDLWVAGPNDRLSLNPNNPRAVSAAQRFMGTPGGGIPSEMFSKDPTQFLDKMNIGKRGGPLFDTAITGGQQIPYRKTPGGVEGSIFDRWDYTLDPKESAFLLENRRNMSDPAWRKQPFEPKEPLSKYFRKGDFPNNEAAWRSLAGRWALDNIVAYKHPWITQRFRTELDPTPQPPRPDYDIRPVINQRLQLLTPEGAPMGGPITPESNEDFMRRPLAVK